MNSNGNVVDANPATTAGDEQLSLIDAFLNPLAFLSRGADAVHVLEHAAGVVGDIEAEVVAVACVPGRGQPDISSLPSKISSSSSKRIRMCRL